MTVDAAGSAPRADGPAAHGSVLVVDDEPAVLTVLAIALRNAGYTVLTAGDGIAAVETYRRNSSDIAAVVLDLTMPGMGGDEVFGELKKIDPAVRVILTSGYQKQDAAGRFDSHNVVAFLQKPFRPQDLRDALAHAARHPPD